MFVYLLDIVFFVVCVKVFNMLIFIVFRFLFGVFGVCLFINGGGIIVDCVW